MSGRFSGVFGGGAGRAGACALAAVLSLWAPAASAAGPSRAAGGAGGPMVLVPAGWFVMGSEEGNEEEAPRRRVYLDAFYIDKYPVTNARFRGKKTQEYGGAFSSPGHPAVGVTWFQARAHCRAVGRRLPTEAEWEKAARGTEGRKYPWGGRWDPSRLLWAANSAERTHPVVRTYAVNTSPFGAVDMAGHVWEWVADWFGADTYRRAPSRNPRGPARGKNRVLRGGSWYSDDPWELDAADRHRIVPEFWDNDIGFRCAKDAR